METTEDTDWLSDANGNKCSISYFGTREAAQKALDSLRNCSYCSDCLYCSDCSYCSYCSDCSKVSEQKNKQAAGPPPVPKIDGIHKRLYEAASQTGALNMSDWHTCGTTHCRAGWVVHLAGEAGYALERFLGAALAAQLIYRESGYRINPGQFYVRNDEAMADMKRLAEAD